ncbi:MAG: hypothetical protein LBN00_10015 [Oscillospiraceae bacterium]|jgi:hypothetical protein|nr:hypothetical protein [Oscillospiraceae bacterium]
MSKPKKKRKMQFSKFVCCFGMVLVPIVYFMDFALSLLGKEPLGETTRSVITIFGGFCTGGYFTLTGARDLSLNKHGVKINNDDNDNV